MSILATDNWVDDYTTDEDVEVQEYDITTIPNDFNIATLYQYIDSGIFVIPGFQRNFVWDIKKSSKLIESLILGLPVPQLFLYEQERNKFLVIDGQQRLMSIYYFIKERFPLPEKRSELRKIFDEYGSLPNKILEDDEYFTDFSLTLPSYLSNQPNSYANKSYTTLGEAKLQFELRPIRNIIVRQNTPKDDDSSVYEIFSRLNSGGLNLTPQEIRLSLHHSEFYNILMDLNLEEGWRKILSNPNPDLRSRDIEILLRIFAMLIDGDNYTPKMIDFLNQFSKKSQKHSSKQNDFVKRLFQSFLQASQNLPDRAFFNEKTSKFSLALIEAVFTSASRKAFQEKRELQGHLNIEEIEKLANDRKFQETTITASTNTLNVKKRLELGVKYITAL
ncbi:MAG: DUF262 domain-containing protein [Cyanobacteria bacterium SBLK]|nr:DUF262 domain-containing protein [Cyanobacteria bacterium SBLK]